MTTDFRAELQALLNEIHELRIEGGLPKTESFCLALNRARAALAEPEPEVPPVWTEGICGDGAALLRDGVMIPIEEVVRELNRGDQARAARRPKPPSLAEEGQRILVENGSTLDGRVELDPEDVATIRAALIRLQELEQLND